MRFCFVLLLGAVLAGSVCGQQKSDLQDPEMQLSNPISAEQLRLLAQMHKPPPLSLQAGLKLAEKFIRKEKIDTSSCYLFEGKLLFASPPQESNWRFWWICSADDGKTLKDLKITVSMRGVAKRLP